MGMKKEREKEERGLWAEGGGVNQNPFDFPWECLTCCSFSVLSYPLIPESTQRGFALDSLYGSVKTCDCQRDRRTASCGKIWEVRLGNVGLT